MTLPLTQILRSSIPEVTESAFRIRRPYRLYALSEPSVSPTAATADTAADTRGSSGIYPRTVSVKVVQDEEAERVVEADEGGLDHNDDEASFAGEEELHIGEEDVEIVELDGSPSLICLSADRKVGRTDLMSSSGEGAKYTLFQNRPRSTRGRGLTLLELSSASRRAIALILLALPA